jgi:hypothetical protein
MDGWQIDAIMHAGVGSTAQSACIGAVNLWQAHNAQVHATLLAPAPPPVSDCRVPIDRWCLKAHGIRQSAPRPRAAIS